MNVARFNLGNILTLVAMAGAFAVFLMRYESRISKIENSQLEDTHRIERIEMLTREMYPKLERLNTNMDWLVKHVKAVDSTP